MVGIIIEANPFHNGHKYFIDKIKELRPNESIAAVMSTSFTMRGEISIIDKYDKIKSLLKANVNLVFELPATLSIQSSDYFAANAINILNKIGVKEIICGCEDDNINHIDYFYSLIISKDFIIALKNNLNLHLSYKETFSKTLKDLNVDNYLIDLFNQPNFTLAYQYYTQIKKNNYPIKLSLIKRNNNFSSATLIKDNYLKNLDISNHLPYQVNLIDLNKAINNLNKLIDYKIRIDNKIYYDKELINHLIKNNQLNYGAYSNKNYSISRIRRALILNLIDYQNKTSNNYLRLIGCDNQGLKEIKKLNNFTKSLIFSSPNDKILDNNKEILALELKSIKLYEIITEKKDLILNDYKLPLKKELL